MKKHLILLFFSIILTVWSAGCAVSQTSGNQNPSTGQKANTTPENTPTPPMPKIDIKSSEVSSLSLNTVYKDFFEAGSKCRQSYNELFGEEDGFFSVSSPCTFEISFNRDGNAEKTIRLERYDKETKQKKEVEKSVWKAKMTGEQFDELAKSIVETEIFQNWNDMISLNVVNTRIKVTYPKGARTLMSNVDAKTTVFLKLMDAFKQLDGKLKWEKTN